VNSLTRLLEAALFSADRPLSVGALRALDRSVSKAEVLDALGELRRRYDEGGHGIELVEVGEGYQVLTRRELAEAIAEARIVQRPRRLSTAALETLAIIAYRQPVSRADIEDIRGVAADGVLRSLQERELIEVTGRGEGLGRPLLYGTSSRFLEMLGLRDLSELPRLEEFSVSLQPTIDRMDAGPVGQPLDELLREGAVGGDGPDQEASAPEVGASPEAGADEAGTGPVGGVAGNDDGDDVDEPDDAGDHDRGDAVHGGGVPEVETRLQPVRGEADGP